MYDPDMLPLYTLRARFTRIAVRKPLSVEKNFPINDSRTFSILYAFN
jgi:hypothetical protein